MSRHWWTGLAVVLGGLLTLWAIVAIGPGGSDRPLDPRSDARLGTSALVALLRGMGADVAFADRAPGGGAGGPDVVLLLADLLDDADRGSLDDWVGAGGRLVVTDPGSPYAPPAAAWFDSPDDLVPARSLAGRCDIDALAGLDLAAVAPRNGAMLLAPRPGDESCIHDGAGRALVVARDRGRGTVVALGGSGLFVNAALAAGENAPVATALLAPEPGTAVLVLEPRGPVTTGGDRSLLDLVDPGVRLALVQLAIAFGVYAAWRARRLGRPVGEPQPSAIAASDLVAATGALLDRAQAPDHAAAVLRADLRRFLGDRLGVPPGAPPDVLAAVAAERTGAAAADLRRALGDEPVAGEAGLADLARTIDRIREEVLTHA